MLESHRAAVFETNSSSTHSLTLASDEILDPLPLDVVRSGVLVTRPRRFGWEWHRYYRAENKIAYLLAQLDAPFLAARTSNADCATLLRSHSSQADALIGRMEEITGVRIAVHPEPNVAIDPNSAGVGLELAPSPRLPEFILSPRAYVQTGNDGWGPFRWIATDRGGDELFDAGIHAPDPSPQWTQTYVLTLDLRRDSVLLDWSTGTMGRTFDVKGIEELLRAVGHAVCTGMRIFSSDAPGHFDGYPTALEFLQFAASVGSGLRLTTNGQVDLFGADPAPPWMACRLELWLRGGLDDLVRLRAALTNTD